MLSKRALKRIQDELRYPYVGILFEGGNPRKDQWVRLRRSDMVEVLKLAGIAITLPEGGQ